MTGQRRSPRKRSSGPCGRRRSATSGRGCSRRHLELLREEAKASSVVEPEITQLERSQERALARKAIDALTERDREALLMREEGLDYNEIASALELSVASVGTTLARARRRLMEAYERLTNTKQGTA